MRLAAIDAWIISEVLDEIDIFIFSFLFIKRHFDLIFTQHLLLKLVNSRKSSTGSIASAGFVFLSCYSWLHFVESLLAAFGGFIEVDLEASD